MDSAQRPFEKSLISLVRIGITYNLKSDLPISSSVSVPEDAAEEFDHPETIEAIQEVLSKEGHEVHLLGGDLRVVEKIKEFGIEFVFNIAEGFQGRNREAHIPALLELLGIPYSGSDPLGLALTLDKALAKRIALSLWILTPKFWVLDELRSLCEIPDQFPFFVKPLWEGSSKGIRFSSRVENREQLEKEVKRLFDNYTRVPVLVEEYIPGRELTVAVIGNEPPEIFGIMELEFKNQKNKDFCYSLEVKRSWQDTVAYQFPAAISREAAQILERHALDLFKTFRLRDMARFDFRMNPDGKFYFLEVNPLPGLSPDSGDFVILAKKKGVSYSVLISRIFQTALGRYPSLFQANKQV